MATDCDVIVVGAGLAGLCCARQLAASGRDVLVLEAASDVGGRVRTDLWNGFRLDRGFQVLLTAYPAAEQLLDYQALYLKPFYPGALIRCRGRFHRLADPWRQPWDAIRGLLAPLGSVRDKWLVGRLRRRVRQADLESLFAGPDSTSAEFLREFGFSSKFVQRFMKPFFGGVFLEPELQTSSRMLQFVFRMFAEGDSALPADGMGAIPQQLAAHLPAESVRLRTAVTRIDGTSVTLKSGQRRQAAAVVVATDCRAAATLVPALPPPASRSTTCVYFAADKPPIEEPILVLAADQDGPVNNLCVPNAAAPAYAPPGAALISTTVLGNPACSDGELQQQIRAQLGGWFGSAVHGWEVIRTYRIEHALPVVEPRWTPGPDRPIQLRPGLFLCGDYRENASIQGAMASGQRAAEQVLARG